MLPMETIEGIPVLLPKGRFDSYQVAAINETMASLFAEAAVPQVIVNMMQVHFIGAAAIGALHVWLDKAHAQGGDIKLASLRQTVRMRLDMTQLARFLIYEDNAQAIAAFTSDNDDGDEAE